MAAPYISESETSVLNCEAMEESIYATLRGLDLLRLLDAPSLQRLRVIGFMGVLGPGPEKCDVDTRYAHSLGVAYIAATVAQRCDFPKITTRYLVTACLLHDIANRAFSHTLEGVFDALAETTGREITRAMVLGKSRPAIPAQYILSSTLEELALNPQLVALLLTKKERPENSGLLSAIELMRNPINPDTLDGIARACTLFHEDCPDPLEVAEGYAIKDGQLVVRQRWVSTFDKFWEAKDRVYRRHIVSDSAVEIEQLYSLAAFRVYEQLTQRQLFGLTDAQVRADIVSPPSDEEVRVGSTSQQLTFLPRIPAHRFREPMRYVVVRGVLSEEAYIPVRLLRERYKMVPATSL